MSEDNIKVVHSEEIKPSLISEIPLFQCIKQVRAFEILSLHSIIDGGGKVLAEGHIYQYVLDKEFMEHFKPQVGMMLVFYEDGYVSVSPKTTFDKGYIKI